MSLTLSTCCDSGWFDKSFLTWRTGNAWVHVWAYYAISPHVTVDTRLVVSDFGIK
jgi:hypothetical protein